MHYIIECNSYENDRVLLRRKIGIHIAVSDETSKMLFESSLRQPGAKGVVLNKSTSLSDWDGTGEINIPRYKIWF